MILVDVGNSHARAVRGELAGGRLVDAPEEILTCGTPADGAAARALAAEIADARREDEVVGATSVVPAVTGRRSVPVVAAVGSRLPTRFMTTRHPEPTVASTYRQRPSSLAPSTPPTQTRTPAVMSYWGLPHQRLPTKY